MIFLQLDYGNYNDEGPPHIVFFFYFILFLASFFFSFFHLILVFLLLILDITCKNIVHLALLTHKPM